MTSVATPLSTWRRTSSANPPRATPRGRAGRAQRGHAALDGAPDILGEFARGHLRGVDLPHADPPLLLVLLHPHAEPLGAADPGGRRLLEAVDAGLLAAGRRGRDVLRGQGRLANSRRAEEHHAGAAVDAAAEERTAPRPPAGDGRRLDA